MWEYFTEKLNITPMTRAKAVGMNALSLAFIGDAVHTLYVRTRIIASVDMKVSAMDRAARSHISGKAQAEAFDRIEGLLSESEIDFARRARNSSPKNMPRNMSGAEYMKATAFEAVIGLLYVTGEYDRLSLIMEKANGLDGGEGDKQKIIDSGRKLGER